MDLDVSGSRAQALEWEAKWAVPAALATLAAVGLVLAGLIVGGSALSSGDGKAELLRAVDAHRDAALIASILRGIGVALLVVPLVYLFRAAQARSTAMRGQLIGIVIAGPLFLAALSVVGGIALLETASDFVAKGVMGSGERANDIASDVIGEGSLNPLVAGLEIAGKLGFTIGMFYSCLHAMRVGLLTRFWGSLGMALGAVSFLFFQFALLWFIYLGVLLIGRVPGGRPPAWAAGEAIPWPTPGERAAESLEGPKSPDSDLDAPIEPNPNGEERRKRKQRS